MTIKRFIVWLAMFTIAAMAAATIPSFLICWNVKTLWLFLPLSVMIYIVCSVKVIRAYIRCKKGTR